MVSIKKPVKKKAISLNKKFGMTAKSRKKLTRPEDNQPIATIAV